MLTRCYIDQPSTNSEYHNLHKLNVLAVTEDLDKDTVRVYYLSGAKISSEVPRNILTEGWFGEMGEA